VSPPWSVMVATHRLIGVLPVEGGLEGHLGEGGLVGLPVTEFADVAEGEAPEEVEAPFGAGGAEFDADFSLRRLRHRFMLPW
jgi:hypothetical protein